MNQMETTEALKLLDVTPANCLDVESASEMGSQKTNFSTDSLVLLSPLLATVYGTVGPFIVTFGLIGNTLILIVVARSNMNGAIPVYLSALAMSDMGALLSSIPLWIRLSNGFPCNYYSIFYYAHLELTVLNTFMASSIFNVMALTMERYTSVCWAGKFPSIHTSLRAKWTVAFSYLVALIISLPLAVLKHITLRSESPGSPGSPGSICLYEFGENVDVTEHWTWTTYVYFGESLVRFVPALVLATLNWLIMIKFRGVVKTRLQMHSTNQPSDLAMYTGRHVEQERKLLTLLTAIIILFFVTNIPSAVLSIIYSQDLEPRWYFQVFRAVANLLEMSNFAMNFCMYFLCSREFRQMLYRALPKSRLRSSLLHHQPTEIANTVIRSNRNSHAKLHCSAAAGVSSFAINQSVDESAV